MESIVVQREGGTRTEESIYIGKTTQSIIGPQIHSQKISPHLKPIPILSEEKHGLLLSPIARHLRHGTNDIGKAQNDLIEPLVTIKSHSFRPIRKFTAIMKVPLMKSWHGVVRRWCDVGLKGRSGSRRRHQSATLPHVAARC
jgi:hypothetical protein